MSTTLLLLLLVIAIIVVCMVSTGFAQNYDSNLLNGYYNYGDGGPEVKIYIFDSLLYKSFNFQ